MCPENVSVLFKGGLWAVGPYLRFMRKNIYRNSKNGSKPFVSLKGVANEVWKEKTVWGSGSKNGRMWGSCSDSLVVGLTPA